MEYIFCKECNNFHYEDKECAPVYTIIHEEEETKIHGCGHWDAAIKYAKKYNVRSDYSLNNDTAEIVVIDGGGYRRNFSISAEPLIYYNLYIITLKK